MLSQAENYVFQQLRLATLADKTYLVTIFIHAHDGNISVIVAFFSIKKGQSQQFLFLGRTIARQ